MSVWLAAQLFFDVNLLPGCCLGRASEVFSTQCTFSEQLLAVKKLLDKQPPETKEWMGEAVFQDSKLEVRLTKCSIFLTPQDFMDVYHAPLSQDVALTEVLTECNRPIRGVAVADPTRPGRRLEVSQVMGFAHSKQVAVPGEQYRKGQHAELYGKLAEEVVQSQGQLQKPLTAQELDSLVARAIEQQSRSS